MLPLYVALSHGSVLLLALFVPGAGGTDSRSIQDSALCGLGVQVVVALRIFGESLVPIYGMAGHWAYWRLLHCALRIVPCMPFLPHCVLQQNVQ